MSKITRFERFENNDGLEFVVDTVSGKAYAAGIRSVARMLKAPESTIRNKIGAQNYNVVMAEIQTNSGVQGAQLIPADVVFELAIEYNPELAKAMGTAGANLYMLGLAGYKVDVKSTALDLEKQLLPKPHLKEIKESYRIFKMAFGKSYADRWVWQIYSRSYPELVGFEPSPEEKASIPTKALLTPTQIAGQLGLTYTTGNPNPKAVNKLLESLGYQEKISGQWSATQKAIELKLCDRKPVDTGSKTQKDQLYWSIDVIPLLQEHQVG